MSFDYFNTSHLAFGSKLTKAFKQLEKQCAENENKLNLSLNDINFLRQYINRNYRIPKPNKGSDPARVDDLFDIINDEFIVKEFSLTDDTLRVSLIYFDRESNRFTIGQGSTTLKKGYAFLRPSVSNINPTSKISFVENEAEGKGKELFEFRIDDQNLINLTTNNYTVLKFKPLGVNHINSLRVGDEVTLPHTATDYEAILILGEDSRRVQQWTIYLELDGKTISSAGWSEKAYHVVYMKPGQVLKGTYYDKAYKLMYEQI